MYDIPFVINVRHSIHCKYMKWNKVFERYAYDDKAWLVILIAHNTAHDAWLQWLSYRLSLLKTTPGHVSKYDYKLVDHYISFSIFGN